MQATDTVSEVRHSRRSLHLWVIAALMAAFTLIYYADLFGFSRIPIGQSFFSSEYVHDLHRSLFLIPMLYTAMVFRIMGAAIISPIAILIMLPRAIFISPYPDPVLRTVLFGIIASTATLSLGLALENQHGQRKALRELASAHRKLESSARLLQASETKYRDLFDSASDAIFLRDLEGKIIETNRAASPLTGYSTEELAKMNIAQLFSTEDFRLIMERQERLLRGEALTQRYELELIRKDGTRAIIESGARLLSQDGQPIGIAAIVRDITEQRRLTENMKFYISEITRAQEEERKRIARELHDETAQSLAALSLDIQAIMRAGDKLSDDALERLKQLRARVDSTMEEVRRFSHELRPGDLDVVGLIPALTLLTEELNQEGHITTRIEVTGDERRLSPEAELALFRIAQEALHNVRKHSQATEAMVKVEFAPRKIKLSVGDNGQGFELPEVLGDFAGKGKLGLMGMQERARLLDADLSIESKAGKGTTVTLEVIA